MYYLICFICSVLILIWIIASDKNLKVNAVLLTLVTVIGDGGYYALAMSQTLDKALLANALTYTIGIFAPMLFFFNICDICKINLPTWATLSMYICQLLLYFCVCSAGTLDIFYKTVSFNIGSSGAYLTKTYGFTHTLYLISMLLYFAASIIISFRYSRKKNIVSAQNVDILIFIFFILIGSYSVERLIHLKVELMPFIYTVGILGILIPVVKVSKYSVERNQEIVSTSMESTGFIVFTNKLLYMDSNDYAKMLFPELAAWEKEKKIPGNGGRFNTFLRPEFMRYVEKGIVEKEKGKSFTMNKKQYGLEFFVLHKGKRSNGYVIKFYDINA